MCLVIPGRVKKIDGRQAVVAYPGQERRVMVGEEGIKVGDWVMVQMGIIVSRVGEREAKESLAGWKAPKVRKANLV